MVESRLGHAAGLAASKPLQVSKVNGFNEIDLKYYTDFILFILFIFTFVLDVN